ncbi:MAG: hypothetical protein Q8P17_02430 [bacterium]|nr:hypothetical protein [bacterium]
MNNELTNLLPRERQRMLSRDYILRIGVIVIALITILVLSLAVLLIPTYVFLSGNASAKKVNLARIEASLSSADEVELSKRLATLSENAASLVALSNIQSVSATIREILSVPRPGITVSGISYTPHTEKSSGTVIISGSSATRDSLRGYQLALQGSQFALSAVLPVSAYAKDSNITFTITVTLVPLETSSLTGLAP